MNLVMLLHTTSRGAIATSVGTCIMIQFNYSFSKSVWALSDLTSERQDLLTSPRGSALMNFIFTPTAVRLSFQT